MASLVQGLLDKVNAASFSLRRAAGQGLEDVPDSSVQDQQLAPVLRAFGLPSVAELKVVLSALVLSECVYKLVDIGLEESAKAAALFASQLPPGLVNLSHVQSATTTVPHRYMLADDGQSLYVVFMGTKHVRDLLADANLLQEAVWKSEHPSKQQGGILAHRGFLARARGIPVEALYAHAVRQGRRLVLCGHSLGGAVALLCTLRLLQGLPVGAPALHCICFGTPAIGNAALASLVQDQKWGAHIFNFILPEDIIPRILALPAKPSTAQPADTEQISQQRSRLQPNDREDPSNELSQRAGAPMSVRNRLSNLRAILTARKPSAQLLEAADAHDSAEQAADVQESAGPQGSNTTHQEPVALQDAQVQQQDSDTGYDLRPAQDSMQKGGRLQALRDALSARWQPQQQQDQQPQQQSATGTANSAEAEASDITRASAATDQQNAVEQPDAGSVLDGSPGRQWLQGIRRLSGRVPGLNRLPTGSDEQLLETPSSSLQLTQGGQKEAIAAFPQASQDATQQGQAADPRQESKFWGLNNRVQNAWDGASSRVRAIRALLPAYAHIGTHQILLPASPAMTKALQTAQQKSLAEERQQAILMHRMYAYRGRAVAICRSAIQWDAPESPAKIGLSNTLAPPITLVEASITISPLPIPAAISESQAAQPSRLAVTQQAGRQHKAQPQRSKLQQGSTTHARHQAAPQQQTASGQGAASEADKAAPNGQACQSSNVQQPAPSAPVAQANSPQQPSGDMQQQQDPLPDHQPVLNTHQESAGPQSPSKRQRQRAPKRLQPQKQLSGASMGSQAPLSSSPNQPSSVRPARWLPSAVPWREKPKAPAKMLIQVSVQGSTHGMLARAQLQVMGQLWCKARLIDVPQTHSLADVGDSIPELVQGVTWRQRLMHTLLWTQPDPTVQQATAHRATMLVQAEVPISLLQAVVSQAEQQQQSQSQLPRPEQLPVEAGSAAGDSAQQNKVPSLLLRLETDFVSKQLAVQVHLPVVWVLGPHTLATWNVWRLLTCVSEQADATEQLQGEGDSATPLPDTSEATGWQVLQQRVQSKLQSLRKQPQPQQPQSGPQVITHVRTGIQYVLIRPTSMRYDDLLSAVLLVLKQLTPGPGLAPVQQQEGVMMQSLPARLRAAFHRQQFQDMQQSLQQYGLPSGVMLLHHQAPDQTVDPILTLIASQARRMRLAAIGIATSVDKIPKEMYGIPADCWITLSIAGQSQSDAHQMQQRVQDLLQFCMQERTSLLSKL